MDAIASQITSLTIVYSNVYSGADQSKHQSSASLAFVWGPVNSPHKWPVTRKMFPFDDVIMKPWRWCDITVTRISVHLGKNRSCSNGFFILLTTKFASLNFAVFLPRLCFSLALEEQVIWSSLARTVVRHVIFAKYIIYRDKVRPVPEFYGRSLPRSLGCRSFQFKQNVSSLFRIYVHNCKHTTVYQ